MRPSPYLALAAIALPTPALAQTGTVTLEIPKLSDSPYRKPYVAVWIENASGKQVGVAGVLYDQAKIGLRWLPELRTWWRKAGRAMDMPADGISMPTRAPGRHTIVLDDLKALPNGRYSVVVEAAREKGGRELVKVPFTLQSGKTVQASAHGSRELGKVSVAIER